jgi:uncharacterized protein with GYD domain
MPRYIILISWTDQGVRNVKETAKRAEAARKAAEKLGGELELYYTLGEYDMVGIGEAPSDEAEMQLLLQVGALGNVRTKTLKAWTESEAAKVVAKLS